MSTNSRFTVAVHVLAGLALFEKNGASMTSEQAAQSVNTNPVVVRRIMGDLRKAGLVASQPGTHGGWHFVRPPHTITLRDVYLAVADESLFAMHHRQPNSACPIGRGIQGVLTRYFERAEAALLDELRQTTVAQVLDEILAQPAAIN